MEAAEAGFPGVWLEWRRAGATAVVCADDVFAYGAGSRRTLEPSCARGRRSGGMQRPSDVGPDGPR
jgi:hypothetical protein